MSRQPLAIDLFAGLGGWSEGCLAEGWRVIGFDIERHVYGSAQYPAQLVLQDVLTIHGAQFASADLIVASPPCHEYSYMAMPWSIAKQKAREYRDGTRDVRQLTALFDACFRIQREACESAGRFIPLVVENVCGAQKWVGRARWHFGSFYLWGDVPALMPMTKRKAMKGCVGTVNGSGKYREQSSWDRGEKVAGFRFDGSGRSFQSASVAVAHNTTSGHGQNPDGLKVPSERGRRTDVGNGVRFTSQDCGIEATGIKQGGDWFNAESLDGNGHQSISRRSGSKSSARKAASAHIAKIPLPLSRWIARAWWPEHL